MKVKSATELNTLTPHQALEGPSPLVLTARLAPVAGLNRFQPAGFPEIGHVIYKAPRADSHSENVCIVDSPASMANHLESVCMRGPHDYELAAELTGMPHVRCLVAPAGEQREVIATSLTEGHRIASDLLLDGAVLVNGETKGQTLRQLLASQMGVALANGKNAHPPAENWWKVYSTLFLYDPNALVHGVLFPKWNIKIPRVLTAHLEAFGAARVDRSGVKFDVLQATKSGQPIFSVDDETAREIRATFIIDVAQVRSFGRARGGAMLGLNDSQKKFLIALTLWKIDTLLATPFRFRSGCQLEKRSLESGDQPISLQHDVSTALKAAYLHETPATIDVLRPWEGVYREVAETAQGNTEEKEQADESGDEEE